MLLYAAGPALRSGEPVAEPGGLIKQRVARSPVLPVLCIPAFDSVSVFWSPEKWFWLKHTALRSDFHRAVPGRDGGRVKTCACVPLPPWGSVPTALRGSAPLYDSEPG